VAYGNCKNSSGSLTTRAEIKALATDSGETSNFVVKNNIAVTTQADTYAIYVGPNVYDSTGLSITNNIWYSTAANWYFWNNAAGNNLSIWNAFPGVGADLNTDPVFVNNSTNNFHPQSSSPAINAATDVGLSQDYQGLKVPAGGAPDIGAYEYQAVSSLAPPKGLTIVSP
jgi:hypothetical protein